MQVSNTLVFDEIRSLSSASMTGSYIEVGTPFTASARILKFINNTNQDVSISLDGSTTHDLVPSGGFCLYDAGTNRGHAAPVLEFAQGTQIYASSAAGTGNFYVVVLYAYNTLPQLPGL